MFREDPKIFLFALVLWSLVAQASPALREAPRCDIFVNNTQGDDGDCGRTILNPCRSLAVGVSRAFPGATVCVDAKGGSRIYDVQQAIHITTDLAIVSVGEENAVIDCKEIGVAFFVFGPVTATIIGLDILNANSGILTFGYGKQILHVSDCNFVSDGVYRPGGGIYSINSQEVIIQRSVFRNGVGGSQGTGVAIVGIHRTDGVMTITNCTFLNNTSHGAGTAVFVAGLAEATIADSKFRNNGATFGGALFLNLNSVRIEGCDFLDNMATETGGAVAIVADYVTIFESNFISNFANGSVAGAALLVGALSLTLQRNHFLRNSAALGGAIAIQSKDSNSTVLLEDNLVIGNNALFGGGLAVLEQVIQVDLSVHRRFTIRGGVFEANTAQTMDGGAIYITMPSDTPTSIVEFRPHWNYSNSWTTIEGVLFERNSASCSWCTGGAIYVARGHTLINNCTFHANHAGAYGGALAIAGSSTAVAVIGSVFEANTATQGRSAISSESLGRLLLRNDLFDMPEGGSFLNVVKATDLTLDDSSFRCPAGSMLINDTTNEFVADTYPWGHVLAFVLSFSCLPCSAGMYSTHRSSWSQQQSTSTLYNVTCLNCGPYMDCSRGGAEVYALPGHWCTALAGSTLEGSLRCFPCPTGYCHEDASHHWDNTCTGNRAGRLCGGCIAGHVEAIGTRHCVATARCRRTELSLLGYVTMVVAMAICLAFLLLRFPSTTHHYLAKLLLHFLQAVAMVMPRNSSIGSLFTFSTLDLAAFGYFNLRLCLPNHATPIARELLSGLTLPVLLLLVISIAWLVDRVIHSHFWAGMKKKSDQEEEKKALLPFEEYMHGLALSVKKKEEEEEQNNSDVPATRVVSSRFAAALQAAIIISYTGVVFTLFKLFRCIDIGDGRVIPVEAGTEECSLVHRGLEGGSALLVGSLPLLLLLLARGIRRSDRWTERESMPAFWSTFLTVIEGPYVQRFSWWESCILAQRGSLAIAAAFILSAVPRAATLCAVCVAGLFLQLLFAPYSDSLLLSVKKEEREGSVIERLLSRFHPNRVALAVLSCLVLLSVSGILVAAYGNNNNNNNDHNIHNDGSIANGVLLGCLGLVVGIAVVTLARWWWFERECEIIDGRIPDTMNIELGNVIGKGGNAIVALWEKDGRKYAVKYPEKIESNPDAHSAGCWENEIEKMYKCKSRFVVPIVGWRLGPQPLIVMKFMAGGSLDARLNKTPKNGLPLRELCRYAKHIAKGLRWLHDNQIVHRDIKPANILLTGGDRPIAKIGDFGTVRRLADKDQTIQDKGTPWYMAPERLDPEGDGVYDCKVDIYSFAFTLYDMAYGIDTKKEDPQFKDFEGNPWALWAKICGNHRPAFPLRFDPGYKSLQRLIERCWHEILTERYTAAQMLKALRKIGKGVDLSDDFDEEECYEITSEDEDEEEEEEEGSVEEMEGKGKEKEKQEEEKEKEA